MKKRISIILIILSVLYIGDRIISKYPESPPKLKVEYNGRTFKSYLVKEWIKTTRRRKKLCNIN